MGDGAKRRREGASSNDLPAKGNVKEDVCSAGASVVENKRLLVVATTALAVDKRLGATKAYILETHKRNDG